MKKIKFKKLVLPTLYVVVIGALFVSISFLGTSLQTKQDHGDMSVDSIIEETVPVVSEQTEETTEATPEVAIVKPYTSDKVAISKTFYDMKDEDQEQQKSLVYYENTYLQNSGVLYSADEQFDIVSVLDGTVTKVSTDEILGNVIEITHNNNLKTVYYSLDEVSVKQDDAVTVGSIIGKSGKNSLENEKNNCLLFEVYLNGTAIDPEEFYNMDIKELQ